LKEFITDAKMAEEFVDYVRGMSTFIKNITSFREAILRNQHDTDYTAHFKEIFRKMSIVFMEKLASKWIYSSK